MRRRSYRPPAERRRPSRVPERTRPPGPQARIATLAAVAGNRAVQRALVDAPVGVDREALRVSFGIDPGKWLMMGNTPKPVGYAAPAFAIEPHEDRERHYKVRVTGNADPGTNASYYLDKGTHATGGRLSAGDLKLYREQLAAWKQDRVGNEPDPAAYMERWKAPEKGKKSPGRVYLVMPGDMAALNKRAEQEHVDDHKRAYRLTLGAAQTALRSIAGVPFGPVDEKDAEPLIEQRFRAALPRGAPTNLGLPGPAWEEEYGRAFERTRRRDDGWHSFGTELDEATLSSFSGWWWDVTYLKVNRGSTEIGTHSSTDVVPDYQ